MGFCRVGEAAAQVIGAPEVSRRKGSVSGSFCIKTFSSLPCSLLKFKNLWFGEEIDICKADVGCVGADVGWIVPPD